MSKHGQGRAFVGFFFVTIVSYLFMFNHQNVLPNVLPFLKGVKKGNTF
jgi:hypothetical protein